VSKASRRIATIATERAQKSMNVRNNMVGEALAKDMPSHFASDSDVDFFLDILCASKLDSRQTYQYTGHRTNILFCALE
jgi:hypothetical protein